MKRYSIALFGLIQFVAVAQGQQGEWEPWFWFGENQGDATVAVNLIHVWDGQTTKVLALSWTSLFRHQGASWFPSFLCWDV